MPTTTRPELLLDTHVWLVLAGGARKLKAGVLRRIELAARANGLSVSAISILETLMLVQRGRLKPRTSDPRAWVAETVEATRVNVVAVDREVAFTAGLIGSHGDPADRLIVATAVVRKATLVTADSAILGLASDTDAFDAVEAW